MPARLWNHQAVWPGQGCLSKTNLPLFAIQQGIQNLRRQPAGFCLIAEFLHNGLERFATMGDLAEADAENGLESSPIFLGKRLEGSCGFSIDSNAYGLGAHHIHSTNQEPIY